MWMLPHMRDHNAHHSDNRGTAEATIPPSRRCPCLSNTNQFYTVAVQRWLFCTIAALFRLWLKACHLAWIDSTVSRNLFLARSSNCWQLCCTSWFWCVLAALSQCHLWHARKRKFKAWTGGFCSAEQGNRFKCQHCMSMFYHASDSQPAVPISYNSSGFW